MNPCAKRLQKELSDVLKSEQTALNGFLVKLDGDNLNKWFVAFGNFPPESQLSRDLDRLKQQHGQDHVLVEVKFPPNYPDEPPFVRIISPRIAFHSGHVTVGGSICIQLLVKTGTSEGWHAALTMEGVLLTIRQLLIDGNGKIDFNRPMLPYTQEEAQSAFNRVAAQHGWFQKKTPSEPPPTPLYDFAVSFPTHWKKGQTKAVEQIELPGFDPADGGEGSAMYAEAADVVKKFLGSWHALDKKEPVVTRVIRLQNQLLFGSFHQRKITMNYINKGNINEQWLYHGTKAKHVDQIIQHGLDARYARSGYLGSGIYCTDNSALANAFTDEGKVIFFGRFLLGEVSQTNVAVDLNNSGPFSYPAGAFTSSAPTGPFSATLAANWGNTNVGNWGNWGNMGNATPNTANASRIAPTRTIYHEGEGKYITTHYDSVGSLYPNFNCPYWAVYSNDQTYPDYIIHYKLA